jgi:hypothetical protein
VVPSSQKGAAIGAMISGIAKKANTTSTHLSTLTVSRSGRIFLVSIKAGHVVLALDQVREVL